MKKTVLCFLILIAFSALLSGCGTPETVPDKVIEWAVEDYLQMISDSGETYSGYTTTISHTPDKETKTDAVTVALTVKFPHADAVSNYEATYQYDKSRELWNVIRGGNWAPLHVERYDITYSAESWINAGRNAGYDSIIRFQGQKQVAFYFEDDPEIAINDGWEIGVLHPEYSGDEGILVSAFEMQTKEDADRGFRYLKSEFADYGVYSFEESGKGENYQFVLTSPFVLDGMYLRALLIQSDRNLFYIRMLSEERIEFVERYDINLAPVLRQVGFTIFS